MSEGLSQVIRVQFCYRSSRFSWFIRRCLSPRILMGSVTEDYFWENV